VVDPRARAAQDRARVIPAEGSLQLFGLPSPRDQLAVIIDGRVIADPAVQSPITGGTAEIAGFATRAQAESLLSSLQRQ
jgi:preprotein translocase subunit SecD